MKRPIKLIGVGASAGGLDALIELFRAVPARVEVAFFVVQHLSPDHASIMAELLAPHTKLPIEEVRDGTTLSAGNIYLCPPAVIPTVDGMVVGLKPRPVGKTVVLPINILFNSMARSLGAEAGAVVLSGTGSDGSEGIVQIAQHGGLVAVQSPDSAEFTGMPQSAISTGCPQIVAPPKELWLTMDKAIRGEAFEKISNKAAPTDLASDRPPDEAFDEAPYLALFEYLDQRFNINFAYYRINSISRRLQRRMDLLGISEIQAYREYLETNSAEAESLYQDLLIGVTEFFRDEDNFKKLASDGIKARLLRSTSEELRIWVAGCATGQEAYSLYILLDELKQETNFKGRITLFATDVFKPSIERAAKGVFSVQQLRSMSEARRQHYFQQIDTDLYKIQSFVRENIIFAHHNFLTDPPFTNMDLVSCRNVLIYLKPEAQESALSSFAYALREDGILFLGSSESLGKLDVSFKTVSSQSKIFRKKSSSLDSRRWPQAQVTSTLPKKLDAPRGSLSASVTVSRQLLGAYDTLLERYAPCGFLVNAQREVLHYFGHASDYCVHVSGRVSSDIAEQLDKHLKLAVTALVHRCVQKNERVHSNGVRCQSRNGSRLVDVSVEPLEEVNHEVTVYMVALAERKQKPEQAADTKAAAEQLYPESLEASEQIKFLENELSMTRENLETANEELQVSNEELQAVNEELQVSNEELQSTNEELHSLNEELRTLNAEYERKNEELISLNGSHENLLESTEDGVLYVDRDRRIRKFNSAIHSAFHLMQNDIGRPLDHIAYRMEDVDPLLRDVQKVLETGERIERDSFQIDGRMFSKRIVPYRGKNGDIEGALLTFTDMTERLSLERRFQFALKSAHLSWWDWDLKSGTLNVHSAGSCLLGESCLEVARDREGWMNEVHPDDRELVECSLDMCLRGETEEWDCEHRFRTTDGAWLWVNNHGVVSRRSPEGEPLEMIGLTRDVNAYKLSLLETTSQRDMLEAAGEIAKMGTWDYDPETGTVEWSAQTRKILAVDEDYDASVEGTFPFILSPDDELLKTAFNKAVSEGVPYDLELRCVDAHSRHCIVRASGRPLTDGTGRVIRVVGIFQDVTDIVTTEHEMSGFFSVSPDFHAAVAHNGQFKSHNASWQKQLGYSAEDLESMCIQEVVVPEERAAFESMLDEVVAGKTVINYETEILNKEGQNTGCRGRALWLSWSLSSDPHLRFVVVSARCVTAQKEAQHDLQEARIRAEEANRAKTDFLAVMSHELRTPLNPILGYMDMLIEDAQDQEQKEIFEMISRSGIQMLSLIEELLEYSKLDAGKTKVESVDFSLSDLMAEKAHLMSGMIKNEFCELKHSIDWGDFDADAPPTLTADVEMIRQILRNLLANAIKFTPKGEVTFHASLNKVGNGKAIAQFEVKDTGIGIAPKDLEKLFVPFSQVETGLTRRYGGTGLGLAICERLSNLLDGTITVQSALGEGSTFTFKLPLEYHLSESDGESEDSPKEEVPKKRQEGQKSPGRILLVEDNLANAVYLEKLIQKSGVAYDAVSDGESALERLETEDYQLIFLDLHMPGIGGIETLKRLRTKESESGKSPTVVVILTADALEDVREECMASGADDLLIKPVSPANVSAAITRHVPGA